MNIENLKKISLFADLPESLQARLAETCLERSAEEGEFFFFEGDEARHMYILKEGQVKLLQNTQDGQQVAMRIVLPGQMFAGIAMLNPTGGYQVTAQAMKDSSAYLWDGSLLRELADTYPQLAMSVMQVMRAYVQEMQARYREMATERVDRRVARSLLRMTQISGAPGEDGSIQLALSRQDLAEMSGTTLYTVSRILSEWERHGILKTGREKVFILHPHNLVQIAEELGE